MSLSGKRVRLSKLSAVPNAKHLTAKWEDHEAGGEGSGQSLPVDYWVEGEICQSEIEILMPVLIKRDNRNGIKVNGFLKTSPVQSVEETTNGFTFSTENSVYKLEVLENQDEQ